MGTFYQIPDEDRVWLYSERGLMSYLVLRMIPGNVSLVLDKAVNLDGDTLRAVLGECSLLRALTEFDLGKEGFGCPDGGLLLGDEEGAPAFIFVEAKQDPFAAKFRAPLTWAYVQDQLAHPEGMARVKRLLSGFNSTINGQLELRWRFVNALKTAAGGVLVSEQGVHLPNELIINDTFYTRNGFQPNTAHPEDWRNVSLGGGLTCLNRLLQEVGPDRFFLLAISSDGAIPPQMASIRLYDVDGTPLSDLKRRLFWMPLSAIENQLITVQA